MSILYFSTAPAQNEMQGGKYLISQTKQTVMNQDWTKFTKRIPISVPIKKLYESWSSQNGLESWFLRKAEFTDAKGALKPRDSSVQKGDKYEWLWHGYPDSTAEH